MNNEIKLKIDAAVKELFYVGEDKVVEISADYRDNADFLLDTIYNNRNNVDLYALLQEKIHEGYFETIWQYEDEILEKAGVVGEDIEEEAREYLQNTYCIQPPYDHFLSQDIKVNIMLATPEEKNCEYTNIHAQYVAMIEPDRLIQPDEALKENTMLSYLLKQQGYTMTELQKTMKEYDKFFYDEDGCCKDLVNEAGEKLSLSEGLDEFNKTHNAFLTSVCQELENQTYDMGVMTVLAKMSIADFIQMQEGNKEITFSKDCMLGIYNPWNGSGSLLEIELEKEFVFSSDMVRDVQIEGVKPQWEYTVDDTYGLIGSCWKEPKSVVEQPKGLDDVIKTCEGMSKNGDVKSTREITTDKER